MWPCEGHLSVKSEIGNLVHKHEFGLATPFLRQDTWRNKAAATTVGKSPLHQPCACGSDIDGRNSDEWVSVKLITSQRDRDHPRLYGANLILGSSTGPVIVRLAVDDEVSLCVVWGDY
jgi:hypothetical protein